MPTQALARRIATVRNRARTVVCLTGTAWTVVLVGVLTVVLTLADWTFHFNSSIVRLALLIGIAAAGCVAAWRWIVTPYIFPLSDSTVALLIERIYPDFEERLASALQFGRNERDSSLGSLELQSQVVAETLERSEHLDFRQAVQVSPLWPALGACGMVAALAAFLGLYAPANARLAMRRLFVPFSAPAWPRQTNLKLLTADFQPVEIGADTVFKIVRGRKLELLVADDAGQLPDDVFLEYRLPDEPVQQETLRHASLRDSSGTIRDVCLLSLPADRGPVRFRALGGDDETMPELEMLVVLPPVVESLQVALTPPRYTMRSAEMLPLGEGRIRGLVGTHVALQAHSSKPLASATLMVNGKMAGSTSVSADLHELHAAFVLSEPGAYSYSFLLKDMEDIDNADAPRYEIEASTDLPPDIVIEEPASDTTVTADAQVPITVSAKDDLGLRDLRIRFNIGDNSESRSMGIPLAHELTRPQHHRASTLWKLRELSLKEGMRIAFHAEASDWFDLGAEHIGKSPERILSIVSAAQKEAEIASRQAELLRTLERAEQSESRVHEQTVDLNVQLDKAGRLKPTDLDVLKRVEVDQRGVSQLLADPTEGASKAVRQLLEELDRNHIANAEIKRRLERFQRELSELRQSHFPVIEEQLTRAVKNSELAKSMTSSEGRYEQSAALSAARKEQKLVLDALRAMLRDLSQWRDWQRVHDDLREVVEGQQKLNNETADVSRATLGKARSELSRQEQADLARLAERQAQLAEQMNQLRRQLREAAEKESGSNSQSQLDAAQTLRSIEQADPESRMREIGGELIQNEIGKATAKQQELLGQLRKLDQDLSQRPERDLQSNVQKMKQTQQQIDSLRKDQAALQQQTQRMARDGKSPPNKSELETLRKEQDSLRSAANDIARELRRLGTQTAGEQMQQAGSHMSRATKQLEQGADHAVDSEQQQAIEQMDRARSALKRSEEEAEQQLSRESLVHVADELAALASRQKSVIDETNRLEQQRARANRWTRGQLRSLQTAARSEQQLEQEITRVAGFLQNADVYAWTLRRGAEEMRSAANRLKSQQTDAITVNLETRAWSRLRDIVQSINFKPPEGDQPANDADSGSEERGNDATSVPDMSQLVLLKMLQQDLLHRTSQFAQQRREASKPPDEHINAEGNRLAAEQGELADLAQRMLSSTDRTSENFRPKTRSQERRREK